MACSQCNLQELCLPVGLDEEELKRLDRLVGSRRKIKRGQHLYRSGDGFEAIYAIRTGFFKTDVLLEDGRDHVTGFQMAGELLGMDGISSEAHTCNAIALEDSEVCLIPFAELEQLSSEVRTLQRHFHKVMSREIVRGYSAAEFHLRMTREEIGSYLGLKLETVSRAFSHFQELGLISVQQQHVLINDLDGLKKLLSHPS